MWIGKTRLHPLTQYILLFALLATLGIQAGLARLSARIIRKSEPVPTFDLLSNAPDGRTLRVLALGHNEAVADLMWLSALSYFGTTYAKKTDPTWLNPHIEAITTTDPRFQLVYQWAGAVIMYSGEIDNASVMASSNILERGVEKFPLNWEIRFMLGVNYYFEMRATSEAQAQEFKEYGARRLIEAAGLPGAPFTLQTFGASMSRRRSAWPERAATLPRDLLAAPNASVARTVRLAMETTLPRTTTDTLLVRRRMMQEQMRLPRWRVTGNALAYMLHPEPLYLRTPQQLSPPTFEETR